MKRANLRTARYRRGLSQEELAEAIGVSRTAVTEWENGNSKPHAIYIGRLCTFFGVDDPAALDFPPFAELAAQSHSSPHASSDNTDISLSARPAENTPPSPDEGSPQTRARTHKEHAVAHTSAVLTPYAPVRSETLLSNQYPLIADSSPVLAQPVQEDTDLFKIGIMALTLHQQQQQWSLSELEQRVTHALDEMVPNMQNAQHMSRRSIFHLIASLPCTLQHFANASQYTASFVLGEVIPFYAASIPACWRLYYEGGQSDLQHILPKYLAHLTNLIRETSLLQKSIAGLLSQGHQLMALLEQERENFGLAVQHCQQAALYAQFAEDRNLQAMALIRHFDTCKENKRIIPSMHLLKEAESFSSEITPLLRGRMFARLSYVYAYQSYEKEARYYLDLAQHIFPEHPENDSSFLYNHTNHYHLYGNQAFTYLHLGQPQQAWESIAQIEETDGPRKIDFIQHQIQIAVALDNLEQSCKLFETLIALVQQYGQPLDMDNAYDAYQHIFRRWPHEQRVRQLEATLQPRA